ncbi:MAG: hypothetical protein Q8928_15295 [Bacteroidota bacterium]|nr:hypothetical protein [Bacteroidota bacterium]
MMRFTLFLLFVFLCFTAVSGQAQRIISSDYNTECGKLCKVFKECKSSALIRNLTLYFVERYGMDEVKTWYFEV